MDTKKWWAGKGGDEYLKRCGDISMSVVRGRMKGLAKPFARIPAYYTIREWGAGAGANLIALRWLGYTGKMSAVEINAKAKEKLNNNPDLDLQDLIWTDVALTCGFLIHQHPNELRNICKDIVTHTRKYIIIMEYFDVKLTEVPYRGEEGLLWKRDFGAFFLDNFAVNCLDYGFLWKQDNPYWDNVTWWLLEKM